MTSSNSNKEPDNKRGPECTTTKKWSLTWAAITFAGMVALQLCFGLFNHKLHEQMSDVHSTYWRFTFPMTTAFDLVFVIFLRFLQNWAVDKAQKQNRTA